jgi:hypothetical protein
MCWQREPPTHPVDKPHPNRCSLTWWLLGTEGRRSGSCIRRPMATSCWSELDYDQLTRGRKALWQEGHYGKVPEVDSGHAGTTMRANLLSLNCKLNNSRKVNFIFYYNQKCYGMSRTSLCIFWILWDWNKDYKQTAQIFHSLSAWVYLVAEWQFLTLSATKRWDSSEEHSFPSLFLLLLLSTQPLPSLIVKQWLRLWAQEVGIEIVRQEQPRCGSGQGGEEWAALSRMSLGYYIKWKLVHKQML